MSAFSKFSAASHWIRDQTQSIVEISSIPFSPGNILIALIQYSHSETSKQILMKTAADCWLVFYDTFVDEVASPTTEIIWNLERIIASYNISD